MRTTEKQSCYDQLLLQRLLSEQLTSEEECAALAHIEQCENCRSLMARLSGNGELEHEIGKHLADHGVDDTGLETVIEPALIEAEIDQIRAMLGPTDDPHMMGRLGTYEIVALIGRGSTGIVFKALDRGLNRFVAIKMLMPCFAGNASARERFAREGRSIASVRDQHVVQVFAVSEHKGVPFIVMEYLPAGSLAQRISKEGQLQTIEVTRIGMQIATALAAAHEQGIVHRDVKPANVLLANGTNRALVTDFGLARLLDEASVTHSGAISGTPQFMSPEQAQGSTIDHRSDLFSLGSVLYAACTAQPAFRSETVFGVIKKVCESQPRPIHEINPRIDLWMCDLIDKLHQKDPEDRFQSAAEVASCLAAELAHAQAPATTPQPKRQWRTDLQHQAPRSSNQKLLPVAIGTVTFGVLAVVAAGLFDSSNGDAVDNASPTFPQQSSEVISETVVVGPISSTRLAVTYSSFAENPEFVKAAACFNAGQFSDAIKHFEIAAKRPDLEGLAYYHIGCSLARLDQEQAAIAALQQAVAAGFADKQHYSCDQDLDKLRNTEAFQQLLCQLDQQSDLTTLLSEAQRLQSNGQFAKAEERYRDVLDMSPNCEFATMSIGLMLHFQCKLDDALPWHQKTARSESYAQYGYYNIACYHALKKQSDEAFFYLQKAVKAGYSDTQHLEADCDLNSIRKDVRYIVLLKCIELQRGQQVAEYSPRDTNQT